MSAPALLLPNWPAPARVRAAFTLRAGGVSHGNYGSLNLGQHVGDDPGAVLENRRRVIAGLHLPSEPLWLTQVHGTTVLDADAAPAPAAAMAADDAGASADAALTRQSGRVLVVQVADCLPVLLARRDGSAVAVAHAGWRGLAAGVVEAAVAALGVAGEELHAWLGPAIGPAHFEVGEEVRAAFCEPGGTSGGARRGEAAAAFVRNDRGRWQCDLRLLARQRLLQLGVRSIHGEPRCTYAEVDAFYSFRRDRATGRMAALIWLDGPARGRGSAQGAC
jgi:polyphenol oxidase